MSNIYIGISLSLICVVLAYIIVSKLILVTVFCAILACVYFKDDLTLLRYLAAHVSLIFLWCFEFWNNIQNMYHQSNSSNFPVRKCIENNGALTNKRDRLGLGLHHRVKSNITLNLSSSYKPNCDAQLLSTKVNWSPGSNNPTNTTIKNSYSPFEQNSTLLNLSNSNKSTGYSLGLVSNIHRTSPQLFTPGSPRPISQTIFEDTRTKYIEPVNSASYSSASYIQPRSDDRPCLDAQLIANVNSPGFCSRIAERLSEDMTHQQKYDSVGAFPIVRLKSQSPKTKVKTPVRVRLAPATTKDLLFTNNGPNSVSRPSLIGADESMKSVLQVLKEISRKRIHSHVDDDCDETSKRLRVSESPFVCNTGVHASLLQQPFQGKRAREDSSPNEADVKKRRKSIQNNEISSSLSSSKSVKAPHLQSQKRKAHAIEDSYNSTPVLGKLLKVQTEVTPPPLNISPSPLVSSVSNELKVSPLPVAPASVSISVVDERVSDLEPVTINKTISVALDTTDEDKTVSRLLGRMSNQSEPIFSKEIHQKNNVFMSTNDLSLSPPKENRLAAMIAVLGGPNNSLDIDVSGDLKHDCKENLIKDLFKSAGTPDTPKLNKKVTFNDSLTTTKIYDKDKSGIGEFSDQNNSSSSISLTTHNTLRQNSPPNPSNMQFSIKPSNSESLKENVNTPRVKSGLDSPSASSTNITNCLFSPQSSVPFTCTPSSGATLSPYVDINVSSADTRHAKPFEFGVGTSSTAINSKDSIGSNTLKFDISRTLSIDNNLKSSEAVITSVANNTFLANIKNNKNGDINTTSAETANSVGEIKNNVSMFPNKDNVKTGSSQSHYVSKPLVNGSAPPTNISSSIFAFKANTTKASPSKLESPIFNTNLDSSALNVSSSPFISTSKSSNITTTSPKSGSLKESLPSSQHVQPFTMFSNVTGSISQTNQNLFENKPESPSNLTVSEDGALKFGLHKTEAPTQALSPSLGGSGFGSSTTALSNSTTIQSNSIFGSLSHNPTPKQNIFGAVENSITQSSNKMFGSSAASTTSQAGCTSFGMLSNNTDTSQSNNGFCPQITSAHSPALFGNILPSTNPQNGKFSLSSQSSRQAPLLGEGVDGSQVSKPLFQSISNPTPTFGTVSKAPTTTGFETQSTAGFGFGNQANLASSPFGSGSSNFGGQTNSSLNASHSTFTQPVENFSAGKGLSNTNTANSSASSLSSPFVFGSPATNTDQAKPSAATKPFSFGSQLPLANPSQLSVAPFSSASSGFGITPQPPAFSSATPQPATPVFAFGQGSTSAQHFQFNAVGSQPAVSTGGGMFNIGSGSTVPRSKTTALRRRFNSNK